MLPYTDTNIKSSIILGILPETMAVLINEHMVITDAIVLNRKVSHHFAFGILCMFD